MNYRHLEQKIDHVLNHLEKRFRIDAHYFFKGGFWLTLGQAVTLGFGLISTALFAHLLSPQEYGIYRYLVGIAAILASFSLTGLGQSVLQATAQKHSGFYRATLKIGFLYSLLITVAGVVMGGYYWIQGNQLLATGCLMVAVIQPLITVFQNTQSVIQGEGKYLESTKQYAFRMMLVTLISVVSLLLTKNVLTLFFFYLIGMLVVNIVSHYSYRPENTVVPKDIFVKYLNYAKHTSVRNLISNIAQKADTVIVFTQLGAVELALYSIATVIPEQVKGSFKNLASLLLPKYAKHEDPKILLRSLPRRSFQLFIVLTAITGLYIVTAPFIYKLLFPKYPDAAFLSQIMALSFPAMVSIVPVSALQSFMDKKRLYQLQILESVFLVLSTTALTITFGVLGAVIAKVATRYATLGYNFYLLYNNKD
jgi:O-antigen/teichoic acid export membrane protein